MKSQLIQFILPLLSLFSTQFHLSTSIPIPSKRYLCQNNLCQLQSSNSVNYSQGISHSHCLLICGEGQLWPYPASHPKIGQSVTRINIPNDFKIHVEMSHGTGQKILLLINEYKKTFSQSILSLVPSKFKSKQSIRNDEIYELKVILSIESENDELTLSTDESYSLTTSIEQNSQQVVAFIKSKTYYGARHGLETVSQLIGWDDLLHSLIIASDTSIDLDQPTFPYRGVMLDLSRHFLPITVIQRTIQAMSYNKMNVLHLHLSDTASFPLEIINQPNLTIFGAYSNEEQITHLDALELAFFAQAHGVIILPEIDTPAHVSAGWQWGSSASLGDLILCSNADGTEGTQWASDALEPPSGQLNLANSNIYPILNDIYRDIIEKFATTSGILHLGGDEVIVGSDEDWAACYNSSTLGQPILQLLSDLGLNRDDSESFYLLWQNFTKIITQLAINSFVELNPNISPSFHFWGGAGVSSVTYNLINRPDVTEILPPQLFTIQVWDDSSDSITKTLIEKGYEIILSNTDYVYLDCGNAGWSNAGGYWCQPYHEWYHIYQYITDIIKKWDLTETQLKKIKGSETLPWGEMIDQTNIDQKLWPRSAALAEALWRDPSETMTGGWYAADPRMQQWRNILVRRGISAEALQPQWCQQRQGHVCTLNAGTPQ